MRHFLITVLTIIALSACRDRVICPAFQSTYILDDSSRMAYFSPLWQLDQAERLKYLADQKQQAQPMDSLGAVTASVGSGTDYFAHVEPFVVPIKEVNKSKFGIIKYEPYWLKNYGLRSAPMENLLAPEPYEAPVVEDIGEFVASDFVDEDEGVEPTDSASLAMNELEVEADTFEIPQLAVVEPAKPTKELKYKYRYDPNDKMLNVEQAYYNKYFGEQLYAYVPIKEKPVEAPQGEADETTEKGNFFLNLIKGIKDRPKKKPADETEEVAPEAVPDEEVTPTPTEEPATEETPDDGF